MIRVRQIKIPLDADIKLIYSKVAKRLHVTTLDIKNLKIVSKSLDARNKPHLEFVYTVDVSTSNDDFILSKNQDKDISLAPHEEYQLPLVGTLKMKYRPVIVGTGPAGLLCGYILAEYGFNPILIERGEMVEERIKTVEHFWQTGELNPESNVQFGEGGAGTFSDGKLVSQVKDSSFRKKKVFDTFIACGADASIGYESKPHIGTDKLRTMVKNMRQKIQAMGGTFRYNTCLTDIKIVDNTITQIELNHNEWVDVDILVLALGHSARDTFKMLYNHNIEMEAKPFAIGVRIEHPQTLINQNQYGLISHPKLGAASYKLTYKTHNNRGVYSFCMCPGGFVVNASSIPHHLAINGMSNHARDEENANSAIIVTISPDDFGHHPLDGMNFQQELEAKAYQIGEGNIPIQLYKDYKTNVPSTKLGTVKPLFKGQYTLTNLNTIFPSYINESLKEAITYFDTKIKGFGMDDAILAAIESRTSSPIRITRQDDGMSSIKGIYPCGEGAGYAGGITSAAMDGIKVAEWIASKYKPFNE